jgi:transcriptional regulator with XRE-family HTH domain
MLQTKDAITRYERAFIIGNVSNLLQKLRTTAGHSQRSLATHAGMGQSEIGGIEKASAARAPELATLVRIARVCGYDLTLVATPRASKKESFRQIAILTPPPR